MRLPTPSLHANSLKHQALGEDRFAFQSVDGGILGFERYSGKVALLRGPTTESLRRQAPRLLQVGLLTPCNLRCSFCYRDTSAPSELTRAFLEPLLERAADWGVLEVAFGGGEPLIFPEFLPMLETLQRTTRLGLNFTTNGVLLTDEIIEALEGLPGEIRVSAYETNNYRDTLKRTRHLRTGLNLMVTPANVHKIEPLILDALHCGADNVLLLGYKGPDSTLHLTSDQRSWLKGALQRLEGFPIRLGICLYPYFTELPHLFERDDCGAGDAFLVITPDKAVQSCSFSKEKRHFETFDELKAIYRSLQKDRSPVERRGCTRSQFISARPPNPARPTLWTWQAHQSNNSNDYSMIARFNSAEQSREAARLLQRFFTDLHAYFIQQNRANGLDIDSLWDVNSEGEVPPPVEKFAEEHHLIVPGYTHGIKSNTRVPNIVSLDVYLFIYHNYCLSLDTGFLSEFFDCLTLDSVPLSVEAYVTHYEISAKGFHGDVKARLETLRGRGAGIFKRGLHSSPDDPRAWPSDLKRPSYGGRGYLKLDDADDLELTREGLRMHFSCGSPEIVLDLEQWLLEHHYWDVHVEVSLSEDLTWRPQADAE